VSWIPVEDDQTVIAGLPVGEVEIRQKGDEDKNPGASLTISIGVTSRTQGVVHFKTDESTTPAETSVESARSSNIEEYAGTQVEEGKDVKIELEITPRREEDVAKESVEEITKASDEVFAGIGSESVVTEYLEIDLAKYVDNTKEGNISDTGTPLEIELDYDATRIGTPVVIRTHNGKATVFKRLTERAAAAFKDATYFVGVNKIYLYSQFFSDFALVYATEKTYYVSIDTGIGDPILQVVGQDSRIDLPTDLTKEGHGFGGWYKDAGYRNTWDPDKDRVSEDTQIYAKWDKLVTGVGVTEGSVTLTKAGEKSKIKVNVKPEDAANKKVTYRSSDPNVATVDADGTVTAVGNGTAIITVTTADGAKTVMVTVTVAIPDVSEQGTDRQDAAKSETVTAAQIEKNSLAMDAGLKIDQKGSKIKIRWGRVKGADGYEVYVAYCGTKFKKPVKTIKNNETVSATITKIGGKRIKLKKNFKLYVMAYKLVDGKKVQLGKTITGHVVGRKNTSYTNTKGMKLKKSKYTLSVGKTAKIKAKTILVDKKKKQLTDAHAKEFRYASSDKSIATVNKKGRIKGVKAGKCTIYVYARNGYAKKISVTVK
ncbi:MAG: Ig-like domain-containing protein, partial [Lachnospiraceae bacterium]|nr:Ig-like domain-containing protein [Lachnospiraceae bacterium]